MRLPKSIWAISIIALILTVDQLIKIWIKTHFLLGEDVQVTNWFHIRFVENIGMAMGIEIGGKLFQSILRILALGAIIYYLVRLIKRNFPTRYIICVSMIFAGAIGNIIDSAFYGVIFSDSTHHVATLFPPEGGYGTWLHGKVVDMFYFPLFKFNWPAGIPWIGGQEFIFFQYIFNLADASISVGFLILVLFFRNTFSASFEKQT